MYSKFLACGTFTLVNKKVKVLFGELAQNGSDS